MFEDYRGKIVHLFGGLHEYVGEIEFNVACIHSATAVNGVVFPSEQEEWTGWIRIKEPCLAHQVKDGKRILETLGLMGGPGHNYEHYVDIYIPPGQSMLEVRVIDPDSDMMRAYKNEISRVKARRIVLPGSVPDLSKLSQ